LLFLEKDGERRSRWREEYAHEMRKGRFSYIGERGRTGRKAGWSEMDDGTQ
jgi:hypothetical protein